MAFDAHKNFAMSAVVTPPSPPTSGTSLTVVTGEGALFPAAPFNATVCPPGVLPSAANAEIVRVTARSGDVLTITRAQEGSVARAVVVGDLCVASVTAKALQDIETTPYARTDAANTFTAKQEIQTALYLRNTGAVVNQRLWHIWDFTDGDVYWQPQNDDLTGGINVLQICRPGDVKVWRDLYEKQRTTPMGHWIDVPYNAANFTANTGSWTVSSGNAFTYAYCLIGKTLILSCYIGGSSTSGSPTELRVALPGGFTASRYQKTTGAFYDGGGYAIGHITNQATFVACYKVPVSAFGTTGVEVYFTFPLRVD
jgi:hypothetical protein